MNLSGDLLGQLAHLPHWAIVLLGLTAFGIYWKKSQWPNRWLKFINLILPAVAYPVLHYSPEAEQLYWNPLAVLAFHGLGIGIVAEFAHEGIVAKLKAVFPGLKFPEETPVATESTENTEKAP